MGRFWKKRPKKAVAGSPGSKKQEYADTGDRLYSDPWHVKYTRADGKITVAVKAVRGVASPEAQEIVYVDLFEGGRVGILVELAKLAPTGELIITGRATRRR